MRNSFLLIALLATGSTARAQQTPATATYLVAHDSLWARAQRVRLQTAASTERFKAQFGGLGGTHRMIVSLGRLRVRPVTDLGSPLVELKREVVKHKRHGALIKKVRYYSTRGGQVLYEYYEGEQLVRLELFNYPVANEAGTPTLCTMHWVRGDYLKVSFRAAGAGGRPLGERFYVCPVATPY